MKEYFERKILILDDDEDDFIITSDYIRSIAGNAFTIDWCHNYNEGLNCFINHKYDLYFVDYRLGAKTGIDFLKDARPYNFDEPIVLLTGKGNYDIDIMSMQLGAIDYLVKTELTTEKIERCIRYAIGRSITLKALKENESKYRSIFEKSKDVVFVTDHLLNFVDVNPAIETLGYVKDEALKMNLSDLVERDQKIYLHNLIKDNKLEINDKEIVFISKNGENKQCTLTLTPEDTGNTTCKIQGIIHDITNIKLIEKSTIQTEKLAAAGRLLRTIAHEVRNPLNNIWLSAEQLQHNLQEENNDLYINIIQRNSKRINDLITELLSTSKPATNKQEYQSLQSILSEVIAASIDRLTLLRMDISTTFPREDILILTDRNNLKLAILNIVINAIEAMEEEKGKLQVSLDSDNTIAILKIADNGCGIPEKNMSRLFEPFFTKKRNGIGLGLTHTLNILQANNAIIDVSSKVGHGTTFRITFQLAP